MDRPDKTPPSSKTFRPSEGAGSLLEWIKYANALEAKLERYETALKRIADYDAMEYDICHGQRIAVAVLEGE